MSTPTPEYEAAGTLYADAIAAIGVLNDWIDESPANAARDPEARTWGRLAKVGEECGELVAAFIGVTNQNPRKGVTHTMADVEKELLDVALTALCAYAHVKGDVGMVLDDLARHVIGVGKRAGL